MIIEQLIFIITAISLFAYIFLQLIKKNSTKYVPILAIQGLGIGIDFVKLYFSDSKIGIWTRIIIYTLSIIVPLIVIILEKINNNIFDIFEVGIAKMLIIIGKNKLAKNKLLQLIEEKPNNYMAHKMLAEIYENEGGQRKAVDEYLQVIDLNPKDFNSYYKTSELLIDLDKKDQATEILTKLIEKKPDYIEATIALSDLLIEKEDYKEAVNIYNQALKYNPTNYDLNYNLGIAYTMLNDFANAKMYYEKAAELNSLEYNTKYSLAEIALIYKEIDEAEQYFMQTLDDEELCADSYLELAKICLLKKDKEQAIKYANTAIQENPKKIVEKIKKDVTFATIISKLSIPFNLENCEEKEIKKSSKKDIKARNHLEEMVAITKTIGYDDLKMKMNAKSKEEKNKEENQKIIEKEKEN